MKRITLIILTVAAIIAGSVSCQKVNDIDNNPLSAVALSIIPDFSDGSVYSCSDEGSFFLRVSVTPASYIDKLLNNDALICKADFRSVITKATPENPNFTVFGKIASASVEEGYMTASFILAEDELAKLQESDYVVSFSLEDKDGVLHGASTSYVPLNNPRGGQGGDHLIQPNDPVGTIGMLDGVEGMVVELPAVKEGDGNTFWRAIKDYPAKKIVIATKNAGAASLEDGGEKQLVYVIIETYGGARGWRLPHIEELCGLKNIKDVTWTEKGCSWTVGNSSLYLLNGYYVSDTYDFSYAMKEVFYYDLYVNSTYKITDIRNIGSDGIHAYVRLFHDMPEK